MIRHARSASPVLLALFALAGCGRDPWQAPPEIAASIAEVQAQLDRREYEGAAGAGERLLGAIRLAGGDGSAEEATVRYLLAAAWLAEGAARLEEAREQAGEAARLREALDAPIVDRAASQQQWGETLHALGRLQEATAPLERAVALRREAGDPGLLAEAVGRLGRLQLDRGVFGQASASLDEEIALLRDVLGPEQAPALARSYYTQGGLRERMGDLDGAREMYERARVITAEHLPPPQYPHMAWTLNALGIVLDHTGDYEGAAEQFRQALRIAEQALPPENVFVPSCLNNYGMSLRSLGDYDEAIRVLERARDLTDRVHPGHQYAASTRTNLAWALQLAGRTSEARAVYEEALSLQMRVVGPDHGETVTTRERLATLLLESGKVEEARAELERALASLSATLPEDHPNVARILRQVGQVEAELGNLDAAMQATERSLRIAGARLGPSHPDTAAIRIDRAQLRRQAGDRAGALADALQAEAALRAHQRLLVEALPERQALRFSDVRDSGLGLALDILVEGGLPPASVVEVWDAVVRSRALVLDEVMRRQRNAVAAADDGSRDRLDALNRAGRRLAFLISQGPDPASPEPYAAAVEAARTAWEEAEAALARASRAARHETTSPGLPEVLAALPPDTALLAYAREGPRYLAFVAAGGRSDPVAVDLGPTEVLDEVIRAWRREAARGPMAHPDPADALAAYRSAGGELRRRLWDPVRLLLGDASTVLIVPAGEVHLVGFHALPLDDGRYLIDDGPDVHYLSAERDLALPSPVEGEGGVLLALGDPAFSSSAADAVEIADRRGGCSGRVRPDRFPRLPNSALEVEQIAALWRGGDDRRAVLLTGPDASEETFRQAAPGKAVLHLATHGFFLGDACPGRSQASRGFGGLTGGGTSPPGAQDPMLLAGLALAPSDRPSAEGGEDGILTATEIGTLDLTAARWAVLSACDSGGGQVRAGEGVLGLRRAFRVAGARTVIMSLWQVQDEAAPAWMAALYDASLHRGLGTAEAVRAASTAWLQSRRSVGADTHPFYWGGWVASGDWR